MLSLCNGPNTSRRLYHNLGTPETEYMGWFAVFAVSVSLIVWLKQFFLWHCERRSVLYVYLMSLRLDSSCDPLKGVVHIKMWSKEALNQSLCPTEIILACACLSSINSLIQRNMSMLCKLCRHTIEIFGYSIGNNCSWPAIPIPSSRRVFRTVFPEKKGIHLDRVL